MKREVKRYGNIVAVNGVIMFGLLAGEKIKRDDSKWEEIEPKYYIDRVDDMIYEIWYDRVGIVIDVGLNNFIQNGHIDKSWSLDRCKEITKEEAFSDNGREAFKESLIKFNKKIEEEKKQNKRDDMVDAIAMAMHFGIQNEKSESDAYAEANGNIQNVIKNELKYNNNGGASDWYALPEKATTLQDLIEYRNMNGSIKDIFKACYRLGIKTEEEVRDLNKMAYYSLREIGRLTGRKDYITIAKELMSSQSIEKD